MRQLEVVHLGPVARLLVREHNVAVVPATSDNVEVSPGRDKAGSVADDGKITQMGPVVAVNIVEESNAGSAASYQNLK